MSSPIMAFAPTTAAIANSAQTQINTNEMNKVLFATTGNFLATTETILFYVVTSQGGITPVYDSSGAQLQLKASLQSVIADGGYVYTYVKSTTAAAVGMDYSIKPRAVD